MRAENLDSQLEPIAWFILLVIVMMMVTAVVSYIIMKVAQRRKQTAHNKLSASRRDKASGIDLFAKQPASADLSERLESSSRRGKSRSRKGSSFNFITFLKDLAFKFEPKSRSRGKRRRRRSSSSSGSSGNLRIDILKKPDPAPDAPQEPPNL